MSLCGRYYGEYVSDKEAGALISTCLYGVSKRNTQKKGELYNDLMSMMKRDGNMQKLT